MNPLILKLFQTAIDFWTVQLSDSGQGLQLVYK